MLDYPWHHLPIEKIAQLLDSDMEAGLSVEEVARRQTRFGLNQFTQGKEQSAWLRFFQQFHQPIQYILLVASKELESPSHIIKIGRIRLSRHDYVHKYTI